MHPNPGQNSGSHGMPFALLLADDDVDDIELFTEALAETNNTVICYCVKDGKEVLPKLRQPDTIKPALIFLDVNMPGMNGWESLSVIKKDETYKDIPVIMYSTSSHIKDVELAKLRGALCFFTKPPDFSRLKKIIDITITNLAKGSVESICEAIHA
jgi:CheY-like chemotaxis protein